MALRLVVLALCRIALGNILLDDMDENLTGHSLNMGEVGHHDTVDWCLAESHAGNFHHDGAKNKGKASFEFSFEVSQHGCYSLEEYHPGSADNTKCSQLLTTNARLDIDWCVGKKSYVMLDQSKDGGLWNFLGIFPFYVGHPGSLKLSNPAGLEGKYMIADAFRITRIADKCTGSLQQQLWHESEARKQVARKAAKASTSTTVTPKVVAALASALRWQAGSLQLSVQSSLGSDDVDLLASLKAQTSTLAVTLKSHLQANDVVVEDILPLDARRLGGCRRLEAVGNSVDFLVRFNAEVEASTAVTEAALAAELSAALAAVGAKFTIESTELHWQPIDAPAHVLPRDEGESDTLPIVLVGIAAVLVIAVATGGCLVVRSRRAAPAEARDVQKELEEQNEMGQDKGETADKNKDDLDDTASTATPSSDTTPKDVEVDIEVLSGEPMNTE